MIWYIILGLVISLIILTYIGNKWLDKIDNKGID